MSYVIIKHPPLPHPARHCNPYALSIIACAAPATAAPAPLRLSPITSSFTPPTGDQMCTRPSLVPKAAESAPLAFRGMVRRLRRLWRCEFMGDTCEQLGVVFAVSAKCYDLSLR